MLHVIRTSWMVALLSLLLAGVNIAGERRIAVTFDDLPLNSRISRAPEWQREVTAKLLESIRRQKVPAMGFVNEVKLNTDDNLDPAKVALLEMWLDAGLELGNHTYSHPDLNRTDLADYQQDILRGEAVTRRLLAKQKAKPRYFRHPYLRTGLDLEKKRAVESFLEEHGYRVAPVTIDNGEWIYARAYDNASEAGNRDEQSEIAESYVSYMNDVLAYYEGVSRKWIGREPAQVLLLHANPLNADTFDRLATMMRKRDYTFVTLDAALQDAVYASPDTYVGRRGISWLLRWAMSGGASREELGDEPPVPESVLRISGLN